MVDPSEYPSLILVSIIDGLEAYMVFGKPAYQVGEEGRVHVLLRNHGCSREVVVKILDDKGRIVVEEKTGIGEKESKILESPVAIPEENGTYTYTLTVNDKKLDATRFLIIDKSLRKPFYATFVWHHHQAPNYDPRGRIHSPWAYTYVWDEHLKPYGLGPYHYHSVLLKKHPSFKSTYNLSPSLLQQWLILLEKGVEFIDGRRIEPGSREAKLVEETLNNYREALSRNQIDVLTSIYAHTIAGFLTDVLGMHDIVREEVEYGKQVTVKAMGGNYEPLGIWTPEMAFSMRLVEIYSDHGIKYTVLDDQHHFQWAEGDKDSQYEPYILVDPATKKSIVVFFRDHYLSDILGFKNNFYTEEHAWRNAYETALLIAEKWFNREVKSLTIALDGENWMVFAKNKPLTAYYLDKLVIYLEALQDNGVLKLSTLREMYSEIPSKRVLTHIPTNTWLGTFRKWRGEVPEHERYWLMIARTYRKLKAYENITRTEPRGDKYSSEARWYLWHALDSDYWWAEFWKPDTINDWLSMADKLLNDLLSKIRIREAKIRKPLREGGVGEVLVVVENKLEKQAYITIQVSGPYVKMSRDELKPIMIKPGSSYSRNIPVEAGLMGDTLITIALLSNRFIIDKYTVEARIDPSLPPNPI